MTLPALNKLLQSRCIQIQMNRQGHRMRGKPPGIALSLPQRLEKLFPEDTLRSARTDIGLPLDRKNIIPTMKKLKELKELKNNLDLEKLSRHEMLSVNLEQVRNDWLQTIGPSHIKQLADHYGVFKHLYGEGYFIPRVPLEILYHIGDDKAMPVYYGNVIKPSEAKYCPVVNFEAEENTLWTLVMTGLDSHLQEADKEYVHWMVTNIPGGNLEKGDPVVDYMQPIPPRGTGYHRYVFVLYKQNDKLDYDLPRVTLESPLMSRTFVTRDWYQRFEDDITPAGLAFYQSDWDQTLTSFYHNTLQMKEPVYEYDFPEPYIKPQKKFPLREPFNIYMDKYRDPKQINKEFLVRKLKMEHPLQNPEPQLKFPAAHPFPKKMPSWLKTEERKYRLRWGRVNDV